MSPHQQTPGLFGHNECHFWTDPVPICWPIESTDGSSGFIRLPETSQLSQANCSVAVPSRKVSWEPRERRKVGLSESREMTRSHRVVMTHAASSCWLGGCS